MLFGKVKKKMFSHKKLIKIEQNMSLKEQKCHGVEIVCGLIRINVACVDYYGLVRPSV